jgi:hypothetical protein
VFTGARTSRESILTHWLSVIKMEGGFVVSVPFLYGAHEQPYDFRRFTSYDLIFAIARNGFQASARLKCLSAIETIAIIFSVYVGNNVGNKNKFSLILSGLSITFPALTLSKYLAKILPDNRDLFCVLISNAVKTVHLKG